MQEIVEGVYRLGTNVHNFYIATEGGKATVVDAGCSKEWGKLVSGLASIGLGPTDVEAVIVTHAHADHIGFGREASSAGLSIRVHEDEESRALGTYQGKAAVGASEMPFWRPAVWGFFFSLVKAGVMKMPSLDHVETVRDGEELELPGRPRVIHTPGHTEGHAAFFFPDKRLLFTGDALATVDLIGDGIAAGPQLMNDKFHNNADMARASLDRMAGLEADLLLPGHGDPWSGSPADAIAAARSSR